MGAWMKNSPEIGTMIGNKTSEGSSIKIFRPTIFVKLQKRPPLPAKFWSMNNQNDTELQQHFKKIKRKKKSHI